jgi:hypothetical protein
MHVDLHEGSMMNGHHLYHTPHHVTTHGSHHGSGGHHLVEEAILPDDAQDPLCGPGTSESADNIQVS